MQADLGGLFHELVRLETELWDQVERRLQTDHELALAWLEPMQVIEGTPRCRVIDIAEALSITVGGVSKVVDRIEKRGWCRRRPHPNDGRSSIITLTPKGRRLLSAATATLTDELDQRIGWGLTTHEIDQLTTTLQQLRRQLHDDLQENTP